MSISKLTEPSVHIAAGKRAFFVTVLRSGVSSVANLDAIKKAPKIGAFFIELRDYLRRARLAPSIASSPSKFNHPSAPAPAFNGALADDVGAVGLLPAPVAVP